MHVANETSMASSLSNAKFDYQRVPSGKRLHNYRKSPFIIGKSTVNDHFQ